MGEDIEVQSAEPREHAPSSVTWAGRLLIGGGIATSVVAHIAIGSAVLFASPRLFATASQQGIVVDIVSPQEFEQAAKPPRDAVDKDAGTGGAADAASDPAPKLTPQADPPSRVTEHADLPSPVTQSLAQATQQLTPQSQRAQAAPTPESIDSAIPDPSAIVDLLHLPVEMADARSEAPPTETASKLSASEIAEFKGHLKKCWVPPGIPEAKNLSAVVRVALGPNGRLMSKPSLIAASASVYGPALVESVMKALVQCQPYSTLPADKYREWKLLDLNFTKDDVFGVSPASRAVSTGPKG
jgi:hypothetical protein